MTGKIIAIAIIFAFQTIQGQTQPPVVVQALPVVAAPVAGQAAPVDPSAAAKATLQALQGLKATNDEILKKQAATLLQLDEMEKAAEQIKVFSKRG